MKKNSTKSLFFFAQSGCLLPLLIILNLFFGWIFLKPLHWLISEAVLVLLFIFTAHILKRKIINFMHHEDGIIDTEGKVVEDSRQD